MLSIMVNGRLLVSHVNVATRFGCFSAGVSCIPTSHDAHGDPLAVRFTGDLGSACVSFICVRAAAATPRPASVSHLHTSQRSADHPDYSVHGSYRPNKGRSSHTIYIDVGNDNAVRLYINRSQSCTYCLDPRLDIIGRIVEVTWFFFPSNTIIFKQLSFQWHRSVFTAYSIVRWYEIHTKSWDSNRDSAVFISPPSKSQRLVPVSMATKKGLSGSAFTFSYENDKSNDPFFYPDEFFVKKSGSTRAVIDVVGQPTGVAIGPNHRLYM